MEQNIQKLNETNKYNEMEEYLNIDDEYWINTDNWSTEKLKLSEKLKIKQIHFPIAMKSLIKLELKYSIVYCCKNGYIEYADIMNRISPLLSKVQSYIEKMQQGITTIRQIDEGKFQLYLLNIEKISNILAKAYVGKIRVIKELINNFFDDREEIEKDIWNCKNIQGARIPATSTKGYNINFNQYPAFYKECMKRYFRTIITKKSMAQCINIHIALVGFFNCFYEMNYTDGFLKDLQRNDIEKYLFHLMKKYKDKNATYINRFVAYPRIFLEYIQIAQYKEAPAKEISLLIFQDDMPKREKN